MISTILSKTFCLIKDAISSFTNFWSHWTKKILEYHIQNICSLGPKLWNAKSKMIPIRTKLEIWSTVFKKPTLTTKPSILSTPPSPSLENILPKFKLKKLPTPSIMQLKCYQNKSSSTSISLTKLSSSKQKLIEN